MASSFWQPTSPHWWHCLSSGYLLVILTYFQRKIHSEVKELHLKRISASGKETEFVHSSLYIQISNTAMNALPCRQLEVKCYDKLFLLQWQRSMQRVSLRSGMGNLGNMHPHLRLSLEDVSHHFAGNSHHL